VPASLEVGGRWDEEPGEGEDLYCIPAFLERFHRVFCQYPEASENSTLQGVKEHKETYTKAHCMEVREGGIGIEKERTSITRHILSSVQVLHPKMCPQSY
jgi:hypothetical protein